MTTNDQSNLDQLQNGEDIVDSIDLEKELKRDGDIFVEKFQEWAEIQGEKVFFYYGEEDKRYTYREFNRLANSIAHNLRSLGVKKGDRVSLFLLNPLVTTLTMFGIWKIGAVYCPINYNIRGKLLAYHINDIKPKVLIVGQSLLSALNHIKSEIPAVQVVLHQPKESDHDYNAEAAVVKPDEKFQEVAFSVLLTGETSNPKILIEYSDSANIIYTSGTTGSPKGVVLPHRWIRSSVHSSVRTVHPDDVIYNDLPLYHVGGAFFNVIKAAWAGSGVAVWDRFSPNEFWNRIRKSGANTAVLLDVMTPWLMNKEETPEDRNNSLKSVYMQPLPRNHHEVAKRFGIDFITIGYGSTEAGFCFAGVIDEFEDEEGTPKELYKGHSKKMMREIYQKLDMPILPGWKEVGKGFMGKPMIWLEAAVLNEQGKQVGPGVHGQLTFRGKLPYLLLKEYFNKPEATADAIRNGWFQSGDIVYYDENGFFYFVDRIGGFIRVRGENLSSHTVEGLINAHPAISACAVFPVQAAEGNEEDIAAFIVLKQGAELSEEELRSWMKAEMPKFMWPKHIRFVDTLPVTPSFKVEKYRLKAKIMEELRHK